MRITAILRLCTLLAIIAGSVAVGQDSKSPAPLTTEQLVKVRAELSRTKAEQIELRKKLAETQGQLAGCYTEFELDDLRISELQAEVVATQIKLMDSHHTLHQKMRSILGVERFKSLARRIDRFVADDSIDAQQKTKNEKQSGANKSSSSNSQSGSERNPKNVQTVERSYSPAESLEK